MVSKSAVIPIAALSSIVGVMLIFIWWWFPKWYKKGVQADQDDIDRMRARQREMAAARAAESEASGGEANGDVEAQRQGSTASAKAPVVNAQTYRPSQIATF